jgi:hypothetical protein
VRSSNALALLILPAIVGCDTSGPSPSAPDPDLPLVPTTIERVQGDQQRVSLGTLAPLELVVKVSASNGRGVPGIPVTFTVGGGGGWVTERNPVLTDGRGYASTSWYMGPRADGTHSVTASSPVGATGFRADVEALVPGVSFVGAGGYVELRTGTLPLVLAVSRGGELAPTDFQDRVTGTTTPHRFTPELAQSLIDEMESRGLGTPSVVISRLDPRKVDPDVALPAGAGPHSPADRAWREFHGFLAAATANAEARFNAGIVLDLQGANPGAGLVKFGYLLSAADLDRDDAGLSDPAFLLRSSIRTLASEGPPAFASTVRGPQSLGALLTAGGFEAAPGPSHPRPNGMGYPGGGVTTALHGSSGGGRVNAILVETPFSGVRETEATRAAFAAAMVDALQTYFLIHYGRPLSAGAWIVD